MKLFYQRVSIFFISLSSFLVFAVSSYAFSSSVYVPQNSFQLNSPSACPTDAYDFYLEATNTFSFGSAIGTYGSYTASQLPFSITFSPGIASSLVVGNTYYMYTICDSGSSQKGVTSFVYAPAPIPTSRYVLGSSTQTSINDMTTGSTQSFFTVFSNNWVTLVVFAIGITAFFFFYRLVMKSIRSRGINM